MMSVPEPARRGLRPPGAIDAGLFRYLFRHWPVFLPLFLGLSLNAIESGGFAMWQPAFLHRTYGWAPHQAGLAVGLAQLAGQPIGLFLGAWMAERLVKRNDANLKVVQFGWIMALPFFVAGPLMPAPELAIACVFFAGLFGMMGAPTQNAALQSVVPSELRARITALYLLTYVVAGTGIGPSFVASITDFVIRDEAGAALCDVGDGGGDAAARDPHHHAGAQALRPRDRAAARRIAWTSLRESTPSSPEARAASGSASRAPCSMPARR